MISPTETNDFQWGRSEVVIINPEVSPCHDFIDLQILHDLLRFTCHLDTKAHHGWSSQDLQV